MLITKKSIALINLLFCLVFASHQANADMESGANCNAANLAQALALGMSSSQLGVKNNGASPFFVVCPISASFSATGIIGSRNRIGLGASFPSSGGSVSCVFRAKSAGGSSFIVNMLTVDSPNAGPVLKDLFPVPNNINVSSNPNLTMVCALDPGESIEFYWVSNS